MTWKGWLIVISVFIYLIWLVLARYTQIQKDYCIDKWEAMPIPVWLIIVALASVWIPIFNIFCAIFVPIAYILYWVEESDKMKMVAKNDWLCTIFIGIWKFLTTSIN